VHSDLFLLFLFAQGRCIVRPRGSMSGSSHASRLLLHLLHCCFSAYCTC
jgi:hypothetical protein